jgi:hypothetical protein
LRSERIAGHSREEAVDDCIRQITAENVKRVHHLPLIAQR